MNAHLTDQQLIDYQFDLASEAASAEARMHLEKCETCRRRLHELARKFTALDLLRDDVRASKALLSETIRKARRAGRFRRIVLYRLPWLGAVAAAVIVGIALLAVPNPGRKDVTAPHPTASPPSSEATASKAVREDESMVAAADAEQPGPGLLTKRRDMPGSNTI